MNFNLPVTSKWVRTEELHPKFKYRLNQFFKDPRIAGRVKIVSGVRTLAQQQALYDKYKAGRGNLAANPMRRMSNGMRGSYHMSQEAFGGYGYAVDLRITGKGLSTAEVNRIAAEYGCVKTVPSEWWHVCPGRVQGSEFVWFDAPAVAGDETLDAAKMDAKTPLQIFAEAVAEARQHVLRKGSRGKHVEILQLYLEQEGFCAARNKSRSRKGAGIDGIFGSGTKAAVMKFQDSESINTGNKLTMDGIVGPATWDALIN